MDFNDICKALGEGIRGERKKDRTGKTPRPRATGAIDNRIGIKEATLKLLDLLYSSNTEDCKKKHLVVWMETDETTFSSYSGFEKELIDYWMTERGYDFMQTELKRGSPGDSGRKVESDFDALSIYIQEIHEIQEVAAAPVQVPAVKKATISIQGNKGSLLQEKYEISCEDLEQRHLKSYNIGRGEFPVLENAGYRQNHIVIDDADDLEADKLEANKHVSRTHARLGYSNQIGFYLQVEFGGSRLSGNRTRILRADQIIEAENTEVKIPLHNGDLIELGKAVLLLYTEN